MQDDNEMFSTLEQLVLKAANQQPCEEEFEKIVCFYKTDFDSDILKVQILTVPSNISTVSNDTFETFHGVRKAVTKLKKPVICLINEYMKLLKLIIVMPATNAVSERSFSAMRRLLTYLRSSISKNRLNNSMVLHIYKEKLYNLSLIDIVNYFVEVNVCSW